RWSAAVLWRLLRCTSCASPRAAVCQDFACWSAGSDPFVHGPFCCLRNAAGADDRCTNCAAERHDQLPPPHSITSSARASSVGGTAMPKVLAVLRLTTNSYLVGACTGKSAGF